MPTDIVQEKQQVHDLVDQLAPNQVRAVRGLLEMMLDPVAHSIAVAPVEEEDLTPETAAALDRGHASIQRGEGIRHEDILREFGVTPRS